MAEAGYVCMSTCQAGQLDLPELDETNSIVVVH
jgi:hypothetical protein